MTKNWDIKFSAILKINWINNTEKNTLQFQPYSEIFSTKKKILNLNKNN